MTLDEFGRIAGKNVVASCDYEACAKKTKRDVMHQCVTDLPDIGCRGFFCNAHILITRYGFMCDACWRYHVGKGTIHEDD